MSDYDYDMGSPSIIPSICVAFVVIALGGGLLYCFGIPLYNYYTSPLYSENEKQYQQLISYTEILLNNPNITCEQLQSLRQGHIQATVWWTDPLSNQNIFDNTRDLWNAKNCGNHWGWFES